MSFGGGSRRSTGGGQGSGPDQNGGRNGLPYQPTPANTSVLMAGLMGLRPKIGSALANTFSSGALGRRPALQGRSTLGG